MGIKVGDAYVEIRGDLKKLPHDLKTAHKKIKASATKSEQALKKSLGNVEKQSKTSTTNILKHWKKMVTGMMVTIGAFKVASFVKETALAAARFETLGIVMRTVGKNADYTAEEMDQYDIALRKTGISMTKSRQSLTMMTQAQLDLNQATALGRIAQDAAVIGNINSSEAFQRMIYGIQSGNVAVLKTIGLNVSFEKAYKRVSDATGKAKELFTEAERAIIRQNAVVKYGARIAGVYAAAMSTAGKKLTSFIRYVDDFKVKMGEAFGPATVILVDAVTQAMKDLQKEIVKPETQKALKDTADTVAELTTNVLNLGMALAKGVNVGAKEFNEMVKYWQALGLASAGVVTLSTALKDYVHVVDTFNEDMGYQKLRLEFLDKIIATGKYTPKIYWEAKKLRELLANREKFLSELKAMEERSKDITILPPEKFAEPIDKATIAAKAYMDLYEKFGVLTKSAYDQLRKQHEGYRDAFIEATKDRVTAQKWFIAVMAILNEKMEPPKPADTVAKAYMDLYKDFDVLTENAYNQIRKKYEEDRDAFIAITKDKETAYKVFANRMAILNEKMEPPEPVDKAAKAYMDLYRDFDVLTENAYNQIRKKYEEDRDAFIAITGDKKTAYGLFTNKMAELDERMRSSSQIFFDTMGNRMKDWALDQASTLNEMLWGADHTFGEMAMSFSKMITEMLIKQAMLKAISWGGGMLAAQGGVFDHGETQFASGGVVNRPTQFAFADGVGLMGEAGPEAIMPLTRLPGGDLGVKAKESKSEVQVDIVNVLDPAMFDQYLASSRGQDAVINVMGMKSQNIRRIFA